MEKLVNNIVYKLSTKLSADEVNIVRNVLYLTLKDYDVVEKTTDLSVIENELPKEAKIYLASRLVDGLSENTIKQYKRTLDLFFSVCAKTVNDVTTEDCRLFFFKLQETSKMNNRSLDSQRTYLNSFFHWLVDNEYILKNPCSPIRPFKYEKKLKKELSDIEIERIRNACKNEFEKAVIEVIYSTGCRVSELVNIRLDDVDMYNGEVRITHGKGNKQRMSYLSAKATIAIQEYIKNRNYPSVYLFEASRKPHNQLSARTIEKVTLDLEHRTGIRLYPHKIRRTTATHLWKKGMPIEEIRFFLGHENLDTTLLYVNVNSDSVKACHKKYL